MNLLSSLNGKKTYLVAALTAVTAVLSYLTGKESLSTALTTVPGVLLYLGAGLASVRHAIAKIEAKLPAPVAAVVDPVVNAVETKVEDATGVKA